MTIQLTKMARTVCGLLPASNLKNVMLNRLGYSIALDTSIGPVLLINVSELCTSGGGRIGAFNVLRNLAQINLGQNSTIGSWNWISAAREFDQLCEIESATLVMGAQSGITSRHYIDCSGGVSIGSFSTVAGQRSTILSHGIDFHANEQRIKPVTLGDYTFISTGCTLVSGCEVSDGTVVAAGAVVSGHIGLANEVTLWGGVPARFIKPLSGKYFQRQVGRVEVAGRGHSTQHTWHEKTF